MSATFNGSNQYIAASNIAISGGKNFTLMCWFNSAAASQCGTMLAIGSSGGAGVAIEQGNTTVDSAGGLCIINSPGAYWYNTTKSISTGTWYHVAYSIDNATNEKVVFNGVEVVQGTGTANAGDGSTSVGSRTESGSYKQYFSGSVAEVRIWNGLALTTAQIQTEMRSKQPIFQLANLAIWLPLNNSVLPTTYTDYSGNGRNATPTNTPTIGSSCPF